jgi:hypothetical protein
MAVDLEAIKGRFRGPTVFELINVDVPAMIAEIEHLRSDLAAARAEIAELKKEK